MITGSNIVDTEKLYCKTIIEIEKSRYKNGEVTLM